jgi:prephenate dehydrogenase
LIKRLTIIGVGLIGGSLARALKQANAVQEVIGCSRDEAHLQRAVALGVIDRYDMDMAKAVTGADMVVLAVPVGAMESVYRHIATHLADNAVVTDVGSSKGSVVAAVQNAVGEVPARFVPGHPIAGTEKSGVEASFAQLFQQRRVILTPLEQTDVDATAKVRAMWQATGAIVEQVGVKHHDEVLAATSHLPHMLAFALVDTLATMHDRVEIFHLAAGGFRDFTRIASSDPQMWHDICVNNRDEILAMLDLFMKDLGKLREAIDKNDSDYILEVFQRAKQARDQLSEA